MRAAHLYEALDRNAGRPLIAIAESYIDDIGPVCSADLPDRGGECGCLARIFELPAGFCIGPGGGIRWQAEGEDLVRNAHQGGGGIEIRKKTVYRLLRRDCTGDEIHEFMIWACSGPKGIRRLMNHSTPVLARVRRALAAANMPLHQEDPAQKEEAD